MRVGGSSSHGKERRAAARPARLVAVEGLGLVACVGLGGALALRVAAAATAGSAAAAALAAPAGLLAADLASGIAHWLCDTYGSVRTPLVGRALIQPFREHHVDPLAMTRHGFVELSGNSALAIAPALALALGRDAPAEGDGVGLFVDAFALAFGVAILATNAIHRWAHLAEPPRLVAALQRAGLLLSPAAHAEHHVRHDRAYCVTGGWCNPWLDRADAFRRAERGLARLGVDPAPAGSEPA